MIKQTLENNTFNVHCFHQDIILYVDKGYGPGARIEKRIVKGHS